MSDDRHASHTPASATGRMITVIGSGYVGLTLSACLAFLGHRVTCTDNSIDRVARLVVGDVPIVEEGLTELVQDMLASGRLHFGIDNTVAVADAEYVFLCLPTPEGADGQADLSFVRKVAEEIGPHLPPSCAVITKSTVPVGTSVVVEQALGRRDLHVVSNPEFLAEGSAVSDCLHPDRIVVGARDEAVAEAVASLYGPDAIHRSIVTDLASAELIKYASNAYLATRLTFVNSMAEICEAAGADIRSVMAGMGSDQRIGAAFLRPGPGWGGSCFPKDTMALVRTADRLDCDLALVKTAISKNADHTKRLVEKVIRNLDGDAGGKHVALWGLTFKAGTDDLRQSPALEIARSLTELGALVHAYDPTVAAGSLDGVEIHASSFSACQGADILVVATEWPEFAAVDLAALAAIIGRRVIVDARNLLDPSEADAQGFRYEGIGISVRHGRVSEAAA
jgi:UDPglucose 6-dehydrogenase